jgi:hypothetical protein
MQRRILLGFLLLATLALAAHANPRQRPTFASATVYQHCQTTWMFACGKRDASGQTYGTAHERNHCERYVFQADGTFTSTGTFDFSEGTYRIFAGKVRITPAADETIRPFELALSPDGSKLGNFTRLPR